MTTALVSRAKRGWMPAAALGAAVWGAMVAREQPRLEMHPHDWLDFEEGRTRRRFRSPQHFLHHLRGLAGAQVPLARVYLGRSISPAFRERIMLVTAMANACGA